MQHGKVLTCGEGGAVVTNDDALAPVLQELRADSRRYREDRGRPGEQDLVETASTMGANFCMSEFHAAVLCAQLEVLDRQHEVRNRNYAALARLVEGIPGVRLVRPPDAQTRVSIFELPIVFETLPAGMDATEVAAVLTAELGAQFYRTDAPLHRTPLLQPWTKATLAPLAEAFLECREGRAFIRSDYLYEHSVVTHHSTLLGEVADMADVANAIAKVAALCEPP
jgi:L-glutamine:2-deoxy-scyllo-inosose/3-amino-2,3-dideoxy-scyllo-inosose aminotransferase